MSGSADACDRGAEESQRCEICPDRVSQAGLGKEYSHVSEVEGCGVGFTKLLKGWGWKTDTGEEGTKPAAAVAVAMPALRVRRKQGKHGKYALKCALEECWYKSKL
jgi:hypothetical protein